MSIISSILMFVLKLAWAIIKLPFRIIGWLFYQIRVSTVNSMKKERMRNARREEMRDLMEDWRMAKFKYKDQTGRDLF